MYIGGARLSKISMSISTFKTTVIQRIVQRERQIIGATILGKTFKCIFVDGRGEEDAGAHWAMTLLATLESGGIAHN